MASARAKENAGVHGIGQARERRRLLNVLIPSLVDHPFEHLTLVSLARVSGISLWVLRARFGNACVLLGAATSQAIDDVANSLGYSQSEERGVIEAITDFARFLAERMQGPEYRHLLLIMLRNKGGPEWVSERYDKYVVAKACRDLEEAVLRAGRRHGTHILLREHAAKRLYKRIETAVGLPQLLPCAVGLDAAAIDQLIKDAVQEAFAATYAFEWERPSRKTQLARYG